MAKSGNYTSSRPFHHSKVLEWTLREIRLARKVAEGSVNIETHASIQTLALMSLYLRSAMEEAHEDFVGPLLRDSPEANPSYTSPGLDDSHAPLDVQPLRPQMGPPPATVRVPVLKPSKGNPLKKNPPRNLQP
ncbi:hypothetical protein LIER_16531 [Lithospermum erythrorhizon]|uniref:Uncharacterized protein n=1 Tax=Lithospermum erythrorhizon TaxID=34254 RepID=A0AAV3QCC5_LITER